MNLHFHGGQRNAQYVCDFVVGHTLHGTHEQRGSAGFRQLLKFLHYGVQFFLLSRSRIRSSLRVAQLVMQRDVAGFFSQPLKKQIARDSEEVTFYRGHLDGHGRGPGARKRLGSDVFGFAALAGQVQREAVHVRSIFFVKGAEVHLSAVSLVTPIWPAWLYQPIAFKYATKFRKSHSKYRPTHAPSCRDAGSSATAQAIRRTRQSTRFLCTLQRPDDHAKSRRARLAESERSICCA